MWFPTVAEVLEAHDRILREYGGETGVIQAGAVQSALEHLQRGPFDGDSDVFSRATYLVRGIGLDYPFADGNKRTAYVTADLFLRRNGHMLAGSTEERVQFMLQVAQGNLELDEIARWLREHARKL